jgi:Ca2+-binding EF-hand superfamily protein
MPEIVSSVTPASYGTGDAFNTIKAVGLLPRPGLSGATWDKSAKGPRREIEEHMSQEGGKLQAVHYRISRPCGISGKLLRKYSPDRQPTPITRMHEMDAKRRAAAVAKAKSADILILDRDRPGTRGSLTGASRPGSRASRQATGGGLRAGSKDLPRVHYAEDLGAGDERREEQGLSGTAESLHRLPVKERLHKFSKALTERFPRAVDAFAFIDDDGSGALSVDELAGGLTEVGIAIDVASLKEMMTELGLATRSTIRYKDFLQLFLGTFKPISDEEREAKALAEAQELLIRKLSKNESGAIDENALLAAFQAFDDNGDGWIDQDELRRGFLSFGLGDFDDPNSPMLPFKRLIESCDDNDDGKINYKEFLELAGLTSQHGKNLSVGGGAVSGFREMNKFDAKILERERCRKMLLGLEDIEPDTPKGLTRWRAKYAKSFFGDKYKTNLEKAAKALVDDKAEGRYVEPKLEWNEATRRYMEQVLKVPALKVDSNQTSGVQKFPRSQDQTTWSTSAHDAMSRPYWSGPRSPPPLQRVDATGTNSGILIPGYHPGVTRQTVPNV